MKKTLHNFTFILKSTVTENEIAEGIRTSGQEEPSSKTCFCIIRKISDLCEHSKEPQFSRYADVTSSKELDTEAQGLLQELREAKLEKHLSNTNLMKVDIKWDVSGATASVEQVAESGGSNKDGERQKYLENLSNDFITSVRSMIDEGELQQRQIYDDLTLEVLQHLHLAKFRSNVFEGRGDVLKQAESYVKDDKFSGPMVIHGCSGSGKTSVMAKIVDMISKGEWASNSDNKFVLLPRFLGTTTSTSNLHQLLVSLCSQLAFILKKKWTEPEKFKDLVESFHSLLHQTATGGPFTTIVLLDSIDQLMPAYNAFKMKWLPEKVGAKVKLLVSTIDEGYTIYEAFKSRYNKSGFKDVKIEPLGQELGAQVVSKWLSKDSRQITKEQSTVMNQLFSKCSLPLFVRITYDEIKHWKSYETPSVDALEVTLKGAIEKLFTTLEEKYGNLMVKHSIGYLTAARNGLSESELEHILSLDDTLLNDVFKLWNPPVRRIPPLLWTRVRSEIHSYIVERSADDSIVMSWYHRQFIEAAKNKYLADANFKKHIHQHLVEYFRGTWGGGKPKPFQYTQAQVTRFKLQSAASSKDRQVPTQPYVWVEKGDGAKRFNKRKLSELPFHLIKSKDYENLKHLVFFSYEWLYCKLKSSSVHQLMEEFEIFMQAETTIKKMSEVKLLYSNLQLMRPYIQQFPESLAYELVGRLAKFTGQSKCITALIQDCDKNTHCPIIPLVTSFKTAEVGFTQNITFRKSDPWIGGGAITCTPEYKSLYLLSHNDENVCTLFTYDIASGEKVNETPLNKANGGITDMYSEVHLSIDGKMLIACYRQKAEGTTTEKKNVDKYGLVDIIEIESGQVLRTFDGYLHDAEFLNPIQYLRDNFVCIDFVDKIPVVNIRTGEQKDMNKPSFLTSDEKLFIVCGKNKTTLRPYNNKADLNGEYCVYNFFFFVHLCGNFQEFLQVAIFNNKYFYTAGRILK